MCQIMDRSEYAVNREAIYKYFQGVTLRYVPENSQDKIITDKDVFVTLLKVFEALFINDLSKQAHVLALCPEIGHKYLGLPTPELGRPRVHAQSRRCQRMCSPGEVLFNTLGFSIARDQSSLLSAGTGVFISKGFVPKGTVVSMYPGTVYRKYEPIFFQSLGNPFIFRCIDGVLIDGNDKGLSRAVYRLVLPSLRAGSFHNKPKAGLCLTVPAPIEMMGGSSSSPCAGGPAARVSAAVGQYVNNCSREKDANVCYQEFDVPESFPVELKQYLPNIVYSHDIQSHLRCVVLVTLRDIQQGEELFSNYFTVVN
ncbi:PREDICTED: SET domain-containing protein 9 [Tinamus guttatus]|uniref:SET domain-containing protein 9 n=1 Tax=Tinamus guttatus TaxID=94827 RepID=UPI00052F22D3|nr:PREDICTED: SET domain-containing protein 9 [Tinamus guttatus]